MLWYKCTKVISFCVIPAVLPILQENSQNWRQISAKYPGSPSLKHLRNAANQYVFKLFLLFFLLYVFNGYNGPFHEALFHAWSQKHAHNNNDGMDFCSAFHIALKVLHILEPFIHPHNAHNGAAERIQTKCMRWFRWAPLSPTELQLGEPKLRGHRGRAGGLLPEPADRPALRPHQLRSRHQPGGSVRDETKHMTQLQSLATQKWANL